MNKLLKNSPAEHLSGKADLVTASYTKETVALISSVYFIVYASGQLVKGIIGDIVNP